MLFGFTQSSLSILDAFSSIYSYDQLGLLVGHHLNVQKWIQPCVLKSDNFSKQLSNSVFAVNFKLYSVFQ